MSQSPSSLSFLRADWLAPISVKVAVGKFVVNDERILYNCLNFSLD